MRLSILNSVKTFIDKLSYKIIYLLLKLNEFKLK